MKFAFLFYIFLGLCQNLLALPHSYKDTLTVKKNQFEIKVRMLSQKKNITIKGYDLLQKGQKDQVRITWLSPGKVQIQSSKYSIKKNILENNPLVIRGRFLTTLFQNKLPDVIEIFENDKGGLDLVASMDMDKYLMGVLPSEMPVSWPLEALKAQAVASRTYLLYKWKQNNEKYYHVESSVLDQVFKYNPQISKKYKEKVKRAIKETQYQILWSEAKDKVYPSYYHAHCGGASESEYYVWSSGNRESLKNQVHCPHHKQSNWSFKVTKKELLKALNINSNTQEFSFNSWEKTPTGRQWHLFVGNHKETHLIHANDLRKTLGFQHLKSTLFQFKESEEHIIFQGRGNGHGVGLCQWGAKAWAQQGESYRFILNNYYKNAKLVKYKNDQGFIHPQFALLDLTNKTKSHPLLDGQ